MLMKKIIILLVILLNYSAYSQVDYNVKAVTRTYPVALSFIGTMGYGLKLWGSDSGPLYGYTRAAVYAQTSGVINGFGGQLEVFPVSFLGFYAGSKLIKRSTDDLGSYNCTTIICNGSVKRSYFGSKLGLAGGGLYLFLDGKIEDVEVKDRIGNFAEETGTLIGKSGGDKLTQLTSIFGYDLTSSLSFGALMQLSQMDKIKNKSVMTLGISRMKWDEWSMMLGLGQFHTRQSTNHLTVMAVFSWTGDKGIQLL